MSEDNFDKNFSEYSKEEDMIFTKDVLLCQASELQGCYRYIFDFAKQYPCDELTAVLEYVRLCTIGLEQAYQILDDKLFEISGVNFTWNCSHK